MSFTAKYPIFLVIFELLNLTNAEFVPVYMWNSNKLSENTPSLRKLREDTFKETLLKYVEKNVIVVFAEQTLSPEDFAQHDQYGESAFPNLINQLKHAIYEPYVQNPIRAVKNLGKDVTELSVELFNNKVLTNILVIHLNDAKNGEHRFDMLKRHDIKINDIYKELSKKYDNVLAIYTSHYTSWFAPEQVSSIKRRSLLEENLKKTNGTKFATKDVLMYLSSVANLTYNNNNITINGFNAQSSVADKSVNLTLTNDKITINFEFIFGSTDYWFLNWTTIKEGDGNEMNLTSRHHVYAPRSFSYHCNNLTMGGGDDKNPIKLVLPGFQVQPFLNTSNTSKFGDAYDCVGFTSVPIWSGLFVTMILLAILSIGLTMLMDIKTMDRFDDAKGKTITINASE